MKITFGICTYNRKDILVSMADSLKQIDNFENINIRIYDDCSTEYDENFLRSIFPSAKTIIRQQRNVGADKNTSYMYKDFLKHNDDWFFNADSDLIFRKDILCKIQECIDDGLSFFSLFNTPFHPSIEEWGSHYVKKDSVGAAGCCLRKEIVEDIINNVVGTSVNFDFNFCEYLKTNNIDILTTKDSYVQHIGVNGYNSGLFFDYGMSFVCDSLVNAVIIERTFERYVGQIYIFRRSILGKIINRVFCIPNLIRNNKRRLIEKFGRN